MSVDVMTDILNSAPFVAGLLLILGFFGGKVANRIGLPRVTGYLLVGVFFSPSVSGLIPKTLLINELQVITELALAVIAFTIGGSLELARLKGLVRQIGVITVLQGFMTALLTGAAIFSLLTMVPEIVSMPACVPASCLAAALVFGAIASSTAPGVVMATAAELNARGRFTMTLLGVIALGDALTLILFAVAATIAQNLLTPGSVSLLSMITIPVFKIVISMLIGAVGAAVLYFSAKIAESSKSLLMVVLGVLVTVASISTPCGASPLLANMVLGAVLTNIERGYKEYFLAVEFMDEMIFGLFFTLAGTHLDIQVFKAAGLLCLIFVLIRVVGKQTGAWLGAVVSRADLSVRRYLGLALFPQAGIAIGLAMLAEGIFSGSLRDIVVNTVLGAVILNELVAPLVLKFCFKKAGEVQ